ncbi:hypothetical protein E8E12_006995 [Didymella heteroderae]|uniref:Uncharacterized protein n=1 Tax=Didymella heteroderae TaxID=1769908 RepID=A0A9P4WR85_9PLEO|nr:hypothetical protein E8E12_006995 [Didymella heteroderae]
MALREAGDATQCIAKFRHLQRSSSTDIASMSLPSPTSVSSTPSNTDVTTPAVSSLPEPASVSKAWIAGAIVGPVVSIDLIAVVILGWKKRSIKTDNAGTQYQTGYAKEQPEYLLVQQEVAQKRNFVRPVELPNEQQSSEFPATCY